uniref:Uncharacterized protein n=1 Tax=Arundo donax TaxID=35708 RepID=A0A0A9D4K1_ARUDO
MVGKRACCLRRWWILTLAMMHLRHHLLLVWSCRSRGEHVLKLLSGELMRLGRLLLLLQMQTIHSLLKEMKMPVQPKNWPGRSKGERG